MRVVLILMLVILAVPAKATIWYSLTPKDRVFITTLLTKGEIKFEFGNGKMMIEYKKDVYFCDIVSVKENSVGAALVTCSDLNSK